ncbi:STAS domain-containing protein [Pseudomonas sp. RIT-PI-AD]|uniref:STAS domain-containing protein n=1 Tax=Pseudomonas sp. RIT-PI-AD TaxID=3035294 RepID=UPI0021D968FA|nr:STAS domain-containing protein [Pseudomonas sp. RIT-PI-AD]
MLILRSDPTGQPASLALSGSLTIYEVKQAHDEIRAALAAGERHWQLDLSELEELDSAGAQLLLALQRHLHGLDGQLDVRNPGDAVLELLELLHLQSLYPDLLPASPEER